LELNEQQSNHKKDNKSKIRETRTKQHQGLREKPNVKKFTDDDESQIHYKEEEYMIDLRTIRSNRKID